MPWFGSKKKKRPSSPSATAPRPTTTSTTFASTADQRPKHRKKDSWQKEAQRSVKKLEHEGKAKVMSSTVDPRTALNERQPWEVNQEASTKSLSSMAHKDVDGRPLGTNERPADLTNPTRYRFERPLETIRNFERAIEREYKAKRNSGFGVGEGDDASTAAGGNRDSGTWRSPQSAGFPQPDFRTGNSTTPLSATSSAQDQEFGVGAMGGSNSFPANSYQQNYHPPQAAPPVGQYSHPSRGRNLSNSGESADTGYGPSVGGGYDGEAGYGQSSGQQRSPLNQKPMTQAPAERKVIPLGSPTSPTAVPSGKLGKQKKEKGRSSGLFKRFSKS